jgi:hypothetical protein
MFEFEALARIQHVAGQHLLGAGWRLVVRLRDHLAR